MSESKEIDVHLLWQELGVMRHPVADEARTVIEQLIDTCGKLKNRAEAAEAQVDRLKGVLDKLARLGSEPHYGNSDGNLIARSALEAKP